MSAAAPRRSPLRVLLVTHSLSTGGAERFAATVARHLDRARFAPRLWLATAGRDYAVPEDVDVDVGDYDGIFDLPAAVLRLRRSLVEERTDVVVSNVLSTNCLTGAALSTLRTRPSWVARLGIAPGVGEPWWQRLPARALYPMASAIVANSDGSADSFRRRHPRLAARVRALPNPLDVDRLDDARGEETCPPDRVESTKMEPTLLWVGRLTRQKRVDLLLEAMALIAGDGGETRCRLRLCGDGPLRGELERRATELGVDGSVEFLGFCDNPFAEMRAADLFVLSSDYEGLPNALIEAQALGVPAVATACPHGPDEIVDDGETGRLVPPGDAAALADAVRELLGDERQRRRLGATARDRARRRFAVDRVIPRWERLLAGIAGDERQETVRASEEPA